ncbi:hypothetical protein HZS_4688, partial [Henneguya salminicola]
MNVKDCCKNSNIPSTLYFDFEFHKKYFKSHLKQLLPYYEELDASRILILFFSLSGLKILFGAKFDEYIASSRDTITEWIYSLQVKSKIGNCGGFRGSHSLGGKFSSDSSTEQMNEFDVSHISCTHIAILCLLLLKNDFKKFDRKSTLESIKSMQLSDGSFKCQTIDSESDIRFSYCACVICYLLSGWAYINVDRLVSYISSCQNYDGGFGLKPGLESHGICSKDINEATKTWCCKLQTELGGFCGRPNKIPDTCYSFWVYGTLCQINGEDLVSLESHLKFLKNTENLKIGGFNKEIGSSFP